jgi:DNA-damage-inducible protein D
MMGKSTKSPDSMFESIRHVDERSGKEYWEARELMLTLGYNRWENFSKIIKKTIVNVDQSLYKTNDHIRKVTKMVEIGSNTVRSLEDYWLSRYACYLAAMNSDPTKQVVALAKTYFASQTRSQELLELHEQAVKRLEARKKYSASDRRLSSMVLKRGVDGQGLARIKSDGDKALFGGRNTKQMKQKYGLKPKATLPDYLSPVVLAAKQLANEITTVNTNEKDLRGFNKIDAEHVVSNKHVRKTLIDSNIKPEDMPPEEDIKKIARRVETSGRSRLEVK